MKKFLMLLVVVFTFGLSTVAMNAEAAKRMGSGKSMGTQRQATPDKAPAAPVATGAAAAAPAAAAPGRSWMGPIAGIAAGLGLAALASHLGFGEELASMLMMGLLAVVVMGVIGFVMRKRSQSQQSGQAAQQGTRVGGMQYAPIGAGGSSSNSASYSPQQPAYKVAMPPAGGSMIGSGLASSAGGVGGTPTSRIPADFDTDGFERNAKANFVRLQAANDAGDLNDIRQFTTPEMFAELKMELSERGAATQKTDVVSIQANVLEVDEDADRYLVSVRFTGVIRYDAGQALQTPDESFDEMWHLTKARQGGAGWLLAGIQQS